MMNNKLKNASLLAVALLIGATVNAQVKKVASARYYIEDQSDELSIISARQDIDEAAVHPSTSNLAYMWVVRSMVYSKAASSSSKAVLDDLASDSINNPGQISAISLKNFYANDLSQLKKDHVELASIQVYNAFGVCFNEMNSFNNVKKYDQSLINAELCLFLYDKLPQENKDELKNQNIDRKLIMETVLNIAMLQKDAGRQMEVLKQLIESGTPKADYFGQLSQLYLESKDTAKALQVIQKGNDALPDDSRMFDIKIGFYTATGKLTELMNEVNEELSKREDTKLYYIRGVLNEKNNKLVEAEADYRKALAIDEYNYDANWNLGAIVMNKSQGIYDNIIKAKNATEKAKYEAELTALYAEAKVYLEKATGNAEYGATDLLELYKNLKRCYLQLGEKEKVEMADLKIQQYKSLILQENSGKN